MVNFMVRSLILNTVSHAHEQDLLEQVDGNLYVAIQKLYHLELQAVRLKVLIFKREGKNNNMKDGDK
jgi:hypothetical protein